MPITTFDTLKFVKRLQQAGVPPAQAEVQAEVLTEAFTVNLDNLVTKDYLAARFAEERAYMDTRFAEQDARIDTGFAEQDARIDTRFSEQHAYIDTRFAEQRTYMDGRFSEIDSRFRVIMWILGVIVVIDVIPYLERIMNA